MLEELFEELQIEGEQKEKLESAIEKLSQGEADKIRTEYSKKLKDLEQYKPTEKSDAQIEIETLKKELAETKFQKGLKDIGIDDSISKYLKSDIDLKEFQEAYKGLKQVQKDFVPNKNMGEKGVTKEEFKKMGIAERTKIYQTNPELYAQLKQ